MSKKSASNEMMANLTKQVKEKDLLITRLRQQNNEQQQMTSEHDAKMKAVNELHSQKTKALLKSINNLKREIAKLHEENKSNVRQKITERLNDDIKLQEIAIDGMREFIGHDREDEIN